MNYDTLYCYIKSAILDHHSYAMDVVDSLRYHTDDFLKNIKANLSLENTSDEHINIINLFCICSTREKIDKIKNILLKEIIDRITLGDNFETCYHNPDIFTQYLNTYVHYLLDTSLSPLIFTFERDDITILYLFGSNKYDSEPPKEIVQILDIWYQKELPTILGKQIITQPFYYKNLVGRKSLDIVSSCNDDNLYILLEGNIKIRLDYDTISSYNYLDTGHFNPNDIQKILYNPIYCFGYTFDSFLLFSDWFDIYLYIMALLNIDLENTKKLKESYMAFLDFIEKNICQKISADRPMFNEEYFYEILKQYIKNINQYITRQRGSKYLKKFYLYCTKQMDLS